MSDHPSPTGHELHGLHVLVVEDNDDTRRRIASELTCDGADAHAVGGAVEALAVLPAMRMDVLVSDLSMPGLTGYDRLRKLREQPDQRRCPTPAVALTALTGQWSAALRAGFDAYLVKPFETETLVREVRRLALGQDRG